MASAKTYFEYVVFFVSIVIILGVSMGPQNPTTQVFDSPINYESHLTASTAEVTNGDTFTWNNVRVMLIDELDIVYECPKMLYLNPGATASIDTDYCFSAANVRLHDTPVQITIITNEGVGSLLY